MQLVHILFPVLFTIIFVIFILYMCGDRIVLIPVFLIMAIIVNLIGIAIIEKSAYADTEIWSGRITEIEHKEEWDEWHPSQEYEDTEYYYVNGEKKSKKVKKLNLDIGNITTLKIMLQHRIVVLN